jgi:hypothetical protein
VEFEVERPFWDAVNGVAWEVVDDWGIRWPFGCADLLYALWWRTTPTEMRPSLRGINQAHPDSSTKGFSALSLSSPVLPYLKGPQDKRRLQHQASNQEHRDSRPSLANRPT